MFFRRVRPQQRKIAKSPRGAGKFMDPVKTTHGGPARQVVTHLKNRSALLASSAEREIAPSERGQLGRAGSGEV